MKTFLWTTLFWIVVAIAWLLCLGFWNLWTQVLDNSWIVKFLPNNLQSQVCDPIIASTVEWIDWCSAAEEKGCYQEDEVQEESESIHPAKKIPNKEADKIPKYFKELNFKTIKQNE